jgi:hypothetical protein
MTDDRALSEKVREAISAGRIPVREPARTWGGRGSGALCTICAEVLRLDEVEIELEFTGPDPGNGHGDGYSSANGNGHVAGNGNGHSGRRSNGHGAGTDKPHENVHVHLQCFAAWERERGEIEVSHAAISGSGLPALSEGGTISGGERRAFKIESGETGGSR